MSTTPKRGNIGQSSSTCEDLPTNVVMTLKQGSTITNMDFHPIQPNLLLVGTNTRDLTLWNLGSKTKVVEKPFRLRNDRALSVALRESLKMDYTPSITRVTWSPDGTLLGAAYSKDMVHIYSYHGGDDMRLRLEIKAHMGSVTELAFSNTNFIVTCGDDKSIKVWNPIGDKEKMYRGNEALPRSLCHHFNGNNQFGFPKEVEGKIKLWSYLFSRADYNEARLSSSRMAYSVDSTRLFLSGRNNDGSPYLVEWNERNNTSTRAYNGLRGATMREGVSFDILNDRYIFAGNENLVKVWDMDNANLWMTVHAEGGLPASPCVKLNKQGTLLGVSTLDGLKILSNRDGMKLLKDIEKRSTNATTVASGSLFKLFGKTIVTNTPPV